MCSSDPPPPPDYAALAKQQAVDNKDAAQYNTGLNRANQIGPNGSVTWTTRPGADPLHPQAGDYTQTTSLSPQQQALSDAQNRISQNLSGVAESGLSRVGAGMATPYSTAGLPGLQSGVNTSSLPNLNNSYASQTKAVQDAMYARMAPQLGQNRHAAETRLLNSGIEKGTQAWDAAQQNLGQNENDANMQAVLAGSQEQSRLAGLERGARGQLFGEGATNATFGNQARGQGMQEQSYLRQVPLNELNALRTGSQVTGPSFSGYYTGGNAAGVQSYQAGQDGYNAQVGNVNAQNAANGQLVGAAAGLGGAAISAGALSSLAGGAMLAF